MTIPCTTYTISLLTFADQVMREYTGKVDKLEEAENLRESEAKETEYKPVVLGESQLKMFSRNLFCSVPRVCVLVWVSFVCGLYLKHWSQPDDT